MPLTIDQLKVLLADAVIGERERALENLELQKALREALAAASNRENSGACAKDGNDQAQAP